MTPVGPTVADIRAAHGFKWEYERFLPLSRYIFRPLAFRATWLAIRLEVTSEGVSWLSAVVGAVGLVALVSAAAWTVWVGLGLLALFNLLDCVDGGLARAARTSNPYGRFLDSVCGALVDLAFWAAVGVLAYRHPALLTGLGGGPLLWLAIGGATCFAAVWLHEAERAYEHLLHDAWAGDAAPVVGVAGRDPATSRLRIVDRNLRVRETQYALLGVALAARAIDVLLAIYFVYYVGRAAVALATYAARGRVVRAVAQGPRPR